MSRRWSRYDRMAAHLAPAAELLAARVGSVPGLVIDVGSGSGNGLRAAKAVGQPVVGIDRAAEQLDSAKAVGAPQVRGDAVCLPFRTGSVAGAVSNFGIIFAADQEAALVEVARSLRPGGRLAITAWQPDGWPQPARQALASHLDRNLSPFPTDLGVPARGRKILERAGFVRIEVESLALVWEFADVDEAIDELSEAAGGLRMLRRELEDCGRWSAAADDLQTVIEPRCEPGDTGVTISDRYILYVAEIG